MKFIAICFLLTTSLCCSYRHIINVWKADPGYKTVSNQVLVVAILPDEDSVLRKQIETETITNLKYLGYPALSALDHFGAKGLANMGEEDTYIKLCNSGIDFVLTIALLPKTKEKYHGNEGSLMYPGSYYYNRIWNYQNVQANNIINSSEYFYESILFDLASLRPLTVLRTPIFDKPEKMKISNELTKRLIRKMLKEKILTKQVTSKLPKPF